jgi:hypothetical protein
MTSRADRLKSISPELIADLWLYPTEDGGRKEAIGLGPCTIQSEQGTGWVGYDGWPLLGDQPMITGERRRVGYVFLAGQEAIGYLGSAPKFYIWEGRIIGEATIIGDPTSN